MYVACVTETFAGCDHGVFGSVLVVEAHVAGGGVAGGCGGWFLGGVIRVFYRIVNVNS